MKYVAFPLCLLALACTSNQVDDSDLAGQTFTTTTQFDLTPEQEKDPEIAQNVAFEAQTTQKMAFKDDHTGTLEITMGSLSRKRPFKWLLKNDSIQFVTDGSKGRFLPVQVTETGFSVKNESYSTMNLTPDK